MPLPVSETRICVASAIAWASSWGSMVIQPARVGNEIDEHMEKLIGVPLHNDVGLIQLANFNVLERHRIAGNLERFIQLAADANQAVLP